MNYHRGNHMMDPQKLFRKGQIQQGMHIADFGCGRTGHIIFPASEIIGEGGVIYAVDILKGVLKVVRKRAKMNNIDNIHTVWADLEQVGCTSIPESSLDVGYLINTLCQSKDRNAIMKECNRLLAEKSRFVVVDWADKSINFGPNEGEYVNFEKVKDIGQELGFTIQEEFNMGDYHQGVVFFRHE
ncbi:MAG: class I SAM-dependent methyltransferase [Candidatus Paceibacteria bacterium]